MYVKHRHDMSMCVRDMDASVKHRDTFDLVEALHRPGERLRAAGDPGGQRSGQVFKPCVMRLRDNQRVPLADRMKVQKRHDLVVFMYDMRRQCPGRDLAE